jgi:RNA polymerase-binding transcription factor DksA
MADPADLAQLEIERREALMQLSRPQYEQPEFNADGDKVCIECGNEIPEARAKIPFTVRCIGCQQAVEKAARQ